MCEIFKDFPYIPRLVLLLMFFGVSKSRLIDFNLSKVETYHLNSTLELHGVGILLSEGKVIETRNVEIGEKKVKLTYREPSSKKHIETVNNNVSMNIMKPTIMLIHFSWFHAPSHSFARCSNSCQSSSFSFPGIVSVVLELL